MTETSSVQTNAGAFGVNAAFDGRMIEDPAPLKVPGAISVLNLLVGREGADGSADLAALDDEAEAAVVHARATGDRGALAGLVDAWALPLYNDGRMDTLAEWLGWFGDEELVRYPVLAVHGAWIGTLKGAPAAAERLLALAGGATSTIARSRGCAMIDPCIATLRAWIMRGGVEQALVDADRALSALSLRSGWRPRALVVRGTAQALAGATDRARDDLTAAAETGRVVGAVADVVVAQAQLALLAAKQGAWGEAGRRARVAGALVDAAGLGEYAVGAIAHVATARVALHEARTEDARAAVARAYALRPLLDVGVPWLTVAVGLELTRVHLALAEDGPARATFGATERLLELRPRLGSLVEEARKLGERVAATSGPAGAWAMSLTGAELRLLPYLATHLTFPEIAGKLFLSRNTVKSEAIAIYRKLSVSSRSEAIERAVEVGLLESMVFPPLPNLILDG